MPSPTLILIILLAIATAGVGLLGNLYVGAREDLGRAEQATIEARAAATLCSQETERLAAERAQA